MLQYAGGLVQFDHGPPMLNWADLPSIEGLETS
jgi:hypothetical protein